MPKKQEKTEVKNESIGALWIGEGKTGKFMSGEIELDGKKTRIIVFKNNYKKEDKHPDYRIYLAKEKTEDDLPF